MIPLEFTDKRAALAGAFLNRFGIGFVIGAARLPLPGWASGLVFGLLLSLADALSRRSTYHTRPGRSRRRHHRCYCR